jgi:hypothetical protein
MFGGRGNRLMSARNSISFALAEFHKAKSVKFVGVGIYIFICVSGTGRDRDECACGNSHAIGKCERAQCKTAHSHWRDGVCTSAFRIGTQREFNKQRAKPSARWVSRRKLSILCILSIPAFVQPSSLITASTSSRRGSIYSGFARRRYNTCANV